MKKYTQISVSALLSLVLISSTYATSSGELVGSVLIQNQTGQVVKFSYRTILRGKQPISIDNNMFLLLGPRFKNPNFTHKRLQRGNQDINIDWKKFEQEQGNQLIVLTPQKVDHITITDNQMKALIEQARRKSSIKER